MHPKYQEFLGSIKNLESDAELIQTRSILFLMLGLSQQEKARHMMMLFCGTARLIIIAAGQQWR